MIAHLKTLFRNKPCSHGTEFPSGGFHRRTLRFQPRPNRTHLWFFSG